MKKITSIKVKGSAFFNQDFSIDFSEKLNCIMGGRGAGKSTLLQFIHSCLDKSAEVDRTTFNILQTNLEAGTIEIEIRAEDGTHYRVEKVLGQEPQAYKASSNEFFPLDNILSQIACDIFPAQKIEEIGRSSEERLNLIDRMIYAELLLLKTEVKIKQNELGKNSNDLRSIGLRIAGKNDQLINFSTLDAEIQTLRNEKPPDLDDKERQEFEKHEKASNVRATEERYLGVVEERIASHSSQIRVSISELKRTITFLDSAADFFNVDILGPLNQSLRDTLLASSALLSSGVTNIESLTQQINTVKQSLSQKHAEQVNEFVRLKQRLQKNKDYYDKKSALSKKSNDREFLRQEIAEVEQTKSKLMESRMALTGELNKLKEKIYTSRSNKVSELNALFPTGRIKITLSPGGITTEYENLLRNALKGRRIQYNTLIPTIVANLTPDSLAAIVHARQDGRLSALTGLDVEKAKTLIDILFDTDAIYEIEGLYCPDLPDFHLKIDREDDRGDQSADLYRPSDALSTGQRCTTVLPIVFAISKNPLIIDQPEDNLDNRYIAETIRDILLAQKEERQLIFITHNPNIPVLADAEHNVFLEFKDMQSSILNKGSVDTVKQEILDLLEGGEKAFEKREELYS